MARPIDHQQPLADLFELLIAVIGQSDHRRVLRGF
jgi:hypothetical protein